MINTDNILGKIPPQVIDIERALLGIIMTFPESIYDVCDIMKPEMFYKESHKLIYTAIAEIAKENNPLNQLTVTNQLKKKNELELVGGPFYITELCEPIIDNSQIDFYARLIQEAHIKREIIRISYTNLEKAYDDSNDALELLANIESELNDVVDDTNSQHTMLMPEVLKQANELITKKTDNNLNGLATGIVFFDETLRGLKKDLYIIGARPSHGKTTLAQQFAVNLSKQGISGVIVSIETDSPGIAVKMISNVSGIHYETLNDKNLQYTQYPAYNDTITEIEKYKIVWDDDPGIDEKQLIQRLNKYVRRYKCEYVIIDYLQLVDVSLEKNGTRDQALGNLTRKLKKFARKNCPVIVLSQIRRIEDRADKMPTLSDLRESGNIEADAYCVILLMIPEKYKIETLTINGTEQDVKNKIVCHIAKNKNGKTKMGLLNFDGGLCRISDNNESTPF